MNFDKILNMLSWNNDISIQLKGMELAKKIKGLDKLVMPCLFESWENCAKILYDKTDKELTPYLSKIIDWLYDLNQVGALIIYERLKLFKDNKILNNIIEIKIKEYLKINDIITVNNLIELYKYKNKKILYTKKKIASVFHLIFIT